jgi:hypothetical protein
VEIYLRSYESLRVYTMWDLLGGTSWLSFQDERIKSRQTLACDLIPCLKTRYDCHLIHAYLIVCVWGGGGA